MKTTAHFKNIIQEFLDYRAAGDALFAASFANPDRNIDGCIAYILNTVKKSGCNGFADEEIYSMAVHYYSEKDIETVQGIDNMHIVVNHTVELTEEERNEARQAAIKQVQEETYRRLAAPRAKPGAVSHTAVINRPNLF